MHSHKRNIWILGGTGFIGQALITHLASNTENSLHLLLHKTMNYRRVEAFNTFTGSLTDFDSALLKKYPPDVIFHLARLGGGSAITRYFASRNSYNANKKLVGILANLDKPPVVVYVSGSLMYGPRDAIDPATENSVLSPVAYAKYYFRGELPWIRAQEKGILDVRFARPGWIVGASSWFYEFFWKYYLKTGFIPVYGDGSQFMSIVGLNDCARLINMLSNTGIANQNLNIFALPPISQKEFSTSLAKSLKAQIVVVTMQQLIRKYGKTVALALTTSIPLSTVYPELYQNFKPDHPDLDSIINNTLSVLKNK